MIADTASIATGFVEAPLVGAIPHTVAGSSQTKRLAKFCLENV